jgi:outer membrane protein
MKIANGSSHHKSSQLLTSVMATALISALVTATVAPYAYGQDVNHPLNLKEAVGMAIDNNPSLKQTAETINQADAQASFVRAGLFPNLSTIVKGSENQDATNATPKFNGDTYNQYQTDVHLTQTLYQFGALSAVSAADKSRDINKLNTEIAGRDLTNQVIQAYFQVVLNKRNVDTLKRQEKILRESVSTTEHRAQTGRSQLLDVLQVKTQLALLVSQIEAAENQLQISAASLANLLGDTRAREFHVRDTLEAPELSVVDHEVNFKGFRLPELEVNRLSLEQNKDQRAITIGTNLPNISLVGDYFYTAFKQSDIFLDSSASWSVGVALTIPMFSGLSSVYQLRGLSSQKTQLEYNRVNIENATNLNQVSSRKNLETAKDAIIQGKEALRLAIDSSNEARRKYQLATIDFLQFLTVQQSYVQAEQSYNQFKFNYVQALANYYVASGQDINKLVDLLEGANR